MLVQCEMYEVAGRVICDIICEHCGEVAKEGVARAEVVNLVRLGKPVLCQECVDSKCQKCGRLPTPNSHVINGLCTECRYGDTDRFVEMMLDLLSSKCKQVQRDDCKDGRCPKCGKVPESGNWWPAGTTCWDCTYDRGAEVVTAGLV